MPGGEHGGAHPLGADVLGGEDELPGLEHLPHVCPDEVPFRLQELAVVGAGLGEHDGPVDREHGVGERHLHQLDMSTSALQHLDGACAGVEHFLIGRVREGGASHADSHAIDAAVEGGCGVGNCHPQRAGVQRIVAGDRVEHESAVKHVPGDGACGVHGPRQRCDAGA